MKAAGSHLLILALLLAPVVAGAYEKKGQEMADFDLAIFDSQNRCIMKVLHTAIIRIKPAR